MNEEAEVVVDALELEICLRGPERPSQYGSNRATFAQLKVPIAGQYATRLAVAGEAKTTSAFGGDPAEHISG